MEHASKTLASSVGGNVLGASMALLIVSAVLSAIVDNIPYVASMSPIVADLVAQSGSQGHVLWWALALGADLGGNATAVGASANVVALGLAARNGTPISFWQFTRYGVVVAGMSIALAAPYLWLRYFVFA
jgi:Na+/H+ antiporter NhaD/arsenite permease-like protein